MESNEKNLLRQSQLLYLFHAYKFTHRQKALNFNDFLATAVRRRRQKPFFSCSFVYERRDDINFHNQRKIIFNNKYLIYRSQHLTFNFPKHAQRKIEEKKCSKDSIDSKH
jgi:hypothetical protein